MLNVQRLRVLREVVAQGSFSEAASALNYTQSAVSQAIATLEAEAGVPLIERDRRGVRPTTAGERLDDHAGRILTQLDAAEAELGAIAGVAGGRAADGLVPDRRRDADAARDRRLPRRLIPTSTLSLVEGEPEELVAASARRGVRSRADLRVRGNRRARAGLRGAPLLRGPDEARAAEGPSPRAHGAGQRSRTSPTRPGCRPPRRAPARATSSASAGPRASSRASPSRATTT